MGVFFHAINRNKKSVTLDVRNARGREIMLKLVERADVLVENTRPGNLGRIGLGYDDLVEDQSPHRLLLHQRFRAGRALP